MGIEDLISDHTQTLLIVFLLCVLLVVVFKRPGDIPPGPSFTLPVLGDVLRLRGNPLERFRDMRTRYGDVFSFYLGNRLIVVLNGFDAIKKALVVNADVFSDRPHMFLMDEICEGKGVVATSGTVWKEQRQFAQTTIRMLASGAHSLEKNIQEEAAELINAFDERMAKCNEQTTEADQQTASCNEHTATFDPRDLIVRAVSNIMCTLCFGRRYRYDDPQFMAYLDAIEESFKTFHSTQILNFFPYLKNVPGDLFLYKQTMSHKHFVEHHFLQRNIERVTSAIDDYDVTNFTSAYLHSMREAQSDGRPSSMDSLNLKQSLGNIFSGGTESTTGTLRWALLYFMDNPDTQERCFREIRENIGLNRQPTMKDKGKCPFFSATIMEILRHADVTPLAVAHTVSDDVVFMGYRIPKGCIVLPNINSVLRDEAIWKDPEIFRPERFLDEHGNVLKPEEFIPFSMGRRICLGETIAKMELFLFLSCLLQRFQFLRPTTDELCFDGLLGLTRVPKPFKVKVRQRTLGLNRNHNTLL